MNCLAVHGAFASLERAERVLDAPLSALTTKRLRRTMAVKSVCSIPDCDKPAKGRGWCAAHWWRWSKHGDPLGSAPKAEKPTICCVDGCEGLPNGNRGMCNAHYLRWYRHGDPNGGAHHAADGEPSKWLRDHLSHTGDDCLTWPFATGRDGRGRIQGDVSPQAHRAMCILVHGEPPSRVHEAAHSCGKGHEACVHPQHLYWATPAENCADQVGHGTRLRGERRPGAKLTTDKVQAIRALKGTASHREIGEQFGVDGETVGDIYRGATWGWLAC